MKVCRISLVFLFSLLVTTAFAQTASQNISSDSSNGFPLDEVERFSLAIGQVKNYYVEKVDDKTLFEDAIRGMLSGLDPHSAYLDEHDYQELKEGTSGTFGGLGIEIGMENGLVKVISPLDDTPAFYAGIKAGDYILKLNDKPVRGMSLREAVNIMRGEKGTNIKLIIVRKNVKKPFEVVVKRDVIHIQTVKSQLLEKGFGYVRVSHFQDPSSKDLYKNIVELKKKSGGKLKGLVLDLRNNPGGLLGSAIEVADIFLDKPNLDHNGLIVYTKGRMPNSKFSAYATKGDLINNTPMVVLINGGSASGSEIVAGALQDYERAIIMGTKTFGKGSVQTVIPLGENHAIKLTTALYYTPDGRSIQAKGIEPDVVVNPLEIPKQDSDAENVLNISEADLVGHLIAGKNSVKDLPKKQALASNQALINSDYQLYEALILLKGIDALNN